MATREENLKKINENLEQLSDDELEKVSGGFDVDDFNEKFNEDTKKKLGELVAKYLKLIDDIKP